MHVQNRWESRAIGTTVRYHPCIFLILTLDRYPVRGQYLVGSLSGADASQKVTEAFTKVGYPGMETREIV